MTRPHDEFVVTRWSDFREPVPLPVIVRRFTGLLEPWTASVFDLPVRLSFLVLPTSVERIHHTKMVITGASPETEQTSMREAGETKVYHLFREPDITTTRSTGSETDSAVTPGKVHTDREVIRWLPQALQGVRAYGADRSATAGRPNASESSAHTVDPIHVDRSRREAIEAGRVTDERASLGSEEATGRWPSWPAATLRMFPVLSVALAARGPRRGRTPTGGPRRVRAAPTGNPPTILVTPAVAEIPTTAGIPDVTHIQTSGRRDRDFIGTPVSGSRPDDGNQSPTSVWTGGTRSTVDTHASSTPLVSADIQQSVDTRSRTVGYRDRAETGDTHTGLASDKTSALALTYRRTDVRETKSEQGYVSRERTIPSRDSTATVAGLPAGVSSDRDGEITDEANRPSTSAGADSLRGSGKRAVDEGPFSSFLDTDAAVEHVYREIERRDRIEHERRGL